MKTVQLLAGPLLLLLVAAMLVLAAAPVSATASEPSAPTAIIPQAPAPSLSLINNGDNAWMLASSALVLMMTAPGLILFYGGLVRSKNVLATMMHSLILMSVVSLLWVLYGYSMAFGEGNPFFGSPFQYALLRGVGSAPNP